MPQFDVSSFSAQLFWLFVVFTIFYFVVSKVIAPKAETILTSRNRFMQDNVDSADEYNRKSAEIEELKDQKLIEVNLTAANIRHEALQRLDYEFEKRKHLTLEDLNLVTERALNEVKLFADSFHGCETEPCLKLAAHIINKVTGKPADMNLLNQIEQDYSIHKVATEDKNK